MTLPYHIYSLPEIAKASIAKSPTKSPAPSFFALRNCASFAKLGEPAEKHRSLMTLRRGTGGLKGLQFWICQSEFKKKDRAMYQQNWQDLHTRNFAENAYSLQKMLIFWCFYIVNCNALRHVLVPCLRCFGGEESLQKTKGPLKQLNLRIPAGTCLSVSTPKKLEKPSRMSQELSKWLGSMGYFLGLPPTQ